MEGNRDVNKKILGRKRGDWCQWEEPIRRLSVLAVGLRGCGDKWPFSLGRKPVTCESCDLGSRS